MPEISPRLRRKIIAKYGPTVNLTASSDVLDQILRDISAEEPIGHEGPYDKTYKEGYNKEDYSRSDYVRYDKTEFEELEDKIVNAIKPELDRQLVDKVRAALKKLNR